MKAFNLLLFTIATLGGFGEAAPYAAKLEETDGAPLVARAPIPAYKTVSLSPKATSHHFYRSAAGSAADTSDDSPAVAAVIAKMRAEGQFTAVIIRGAKTSIVGPPSDKVLPDKFLLAQAKAGENVLLTNGGFFIVQDVYSDVLATGPGPVLKYETYRAFAVGPSSVGKSIKVPTVYADEYHTIHGDDNSFLTCGPDLRTQIPETRPPSAQVNTKLGRFQYFDYNARVAAGGKIPNTIFTSLPGGVVTVNEPNERAVLVYLADGTKVAITYTSERRNGMTINNLRALIDQFLQSFLHTPITGTQIALNLDGGGSIFMGWLKDGKVQVLAAGNAPGTAAAPKVLGIPRPYPMDPKYFQFRPVPNMVKHELA